MQNMNNGKSALGLDANITALLGYIVGIIALVLVFIEKDNKFVRFHAIQSLLYGVALFVLLIAFGILTGMLSFISGTLAGLFGMLMPLLWLGFMAGLIFLAYKSYLGEKFKLPFIGDMAEKWS